MEHFIRRFSSENGKEIEGLSSDAMEKAQHHQTRVAEMLGITERTLPYKLKK